VEGRGGEVAEQGLEYLFPSYPLSFFPLPSDEREGLRENGSGALRPVLGDSSLPYSI